MRLQVSWDLRVEGFSERSEEEVALQFALLTVMDGDVRLTEHNTMNLFPSTPRGTGLIVPPGAHNAEGKRFRAGGVITTNNVPTVANPYLGFVVRAIEYDRSNRRADDANRFWNAITTEAQRIVDGGELPTPDDLWTAGNGAGLNDRWGRDDDDKVSTSVRAFPEFGSRNGEAEVAEANAIAAGMPFPAGHPLLVPLPEEEFTIAFVGEEDSQAEGAHYPTDVSIRLVTNGGPASQQSWY